ncbi:MAG: hypothetical protein H6Q58_66 [Firmicutes bacterium]|nr:hypothetical protein [Bacillota bacterium]
MVIVKELPDIIDNIGTFDEYLKDPKKQEFAVSLIKEGSSFIAVKKEKGYIFYPSRFVGHKNNNYDAFIKYNLSSGRDTIEIVSQILKHKPNQMKDLEAEFKAFCLRLGFTAPETGIAGAEHQYWVIGIAE